MRYIKPPSLSTSFTESGKSAKKRFDNILNTRAKKAGVWGFAIAICLIVIIGTVFTYSRASDVYQNESLGFSIELPSNWEGRYEATEKEKSVVFYHKGIREKYGEGTGRLFVIERLEGERSKEAAEDTPWPTEYLMQANGYTYVISMPSDVQYPIWEGGDKALADEYLKLTKDLEKVKKSIKAIAISASAPASDSKKLYDLKGTYIGDNSKVRHIADLANFVDLPIQSIELKTDSKPYAVTINYKVDSRANYRFFDYSSFNKNAAVMFCLIPNADEIHFRMYDNYSSVDNPETSFASAYYSRQDLSERAGMEYFINENIINAASSIESFADYLNKVSAVSNQTVYNKGFQGNATLTQIYHVIGDDCEIVVNSGMQNFITVTEGIAANKTLSALLEPQNIKLGEYIGKKIEFLTYSIRNFKTNQDTSYLFVFDDEKLIAYEDLKTPQTYRTVMDILHTLADGGN